ncbi:MAG: DUF4215 domain-containing protein [Nannocystaceae bacterium]|nr:DUF4215 domain-containing protein [Nannocystaceae bacterium]
MKRFNAVPFVLPAVLVGLWSTAAGAYPAYVRSNVGAPWGVSTNEAAMDAVFGGGAWDDLRFETVDPDTLFSGFYHFIYLEGSDSNAQELDAFLMANQDALETWVGSGGTLFLNAAPNEGGNMNWGFGGVTLTYPNPAGSGSAADGTHPIWNGPFLPCATMFTGGSYAHASIAGVGLNPLIFSDNGGDPNLAEMPFGGGTVIFGGLTTDNFWAPQPDAANLRANIIAYLEAGAQSGPCHNGVLDEGEECDDGNFVNTDDCVGQCVVPTCGDHYVHAGIEECDDGNMDQTDACLIGCIAASCGDGLVQAGVEPCDDANGDNSDICIDTCELASCGDGYVHTGIEDCDDGNDIDGDGCSSCNIDPAGESSSSGGDGSTGTTTTDGSTSNTSGSQESSGGAQESSTGGQGSSGAADESSGGGTATTGVTDASASAGSGEDSGTTTGDTAGGDGAGSGCGCAQDQERGRAAWLIAPVLLCLRRRKRA